MMNENKNHKAFYEFTALIGMFLLILQVGIYRKTIISPKAIIILILIVSIAAFLFLKNDYKKTYPSASIVFAFAQSIFSFGFTAAYVFMAINFYFADNNKEINQFPILSKHTLGARYKQPAIEISYNGEEKQLVFYSDQQNEVDKSKYVLLTIRKGLLGYDILENIQLK